MTLMMISMKDGLYVLNLHTIFRKISVVGSKKKFSTKRLHLKLEKISMAEWSKCFFIRNQIHELDYFNENLAKEINLNVVVKV